MISVLIYKLDFEKVPIANLKEGSHSFGRGPLLECDDRRVSRNHGVIQITSDSVSITSTHQNPCFYQTADSKNITILPKNSPVCLNDGDKFSLLADQFWFKVKIEKNDAETNNNDEILKTDDDSNKSIQDEGIEPTKRNYESDDENVENKKLKLNDDEPSAPSVSKKKSSNTLKDETVTQLKTNTDLSDRDAELKAMLFSSDEEDDKVVPDITPQNSHNSDDTSRTNEIKDVKENDDSKAGTSSSGVKRPWRDYCIYGAQCYRKNKAHFNEYSHPGDSDYESDPNDDRPLCSFGSACYRTNRDHRKAYKHPRDGSNPKKPTKQRQTTKNTPKKRTNRKNYQYESSEDDYDMEDPFMADSGSEFEIDSVSEDDTESDSSGRSEEETKRLVKEAKRFTRRKKKDDDSG